MEFIATLWLPIVLSAVAVFILSSIMHMVLPFHRADAMKLPQEEKLLAAMRDVGLKPGAYYFPKCESMKDLGSDEMKAKFVQGPVGQMNVGPSGVPGMGKNLVQWFVFSLVVGFLVAYPAYLGLGSRSGEWVLVFRVVTSIAILPYGIAAAHESIWRMSPWPVTFRFMVDGLVYAIGTGAVFAWLWPAA